MHKWEFIIGIIFLEWKKRTTIEEHTNIPATLTQLILYQALHSILLDKQNKKYKKKILIKFYFSPFYLSYTNYTVK